jgi:5-methylcytosine-specific restriction endonuclease McrA
MTYSEKLRDPRWQKKRLEIFERDGWKCLMCGRRDRELQAHHVIYKKREPWDYPDYLYQTLCRDCHAERTEIVDKIIDAIRISLMNHPTVRLESSAQSLFKSAMLEVEL